MTRGLPGGTDNLISEAASRSAKSAAEMEEQPPKPATVIVVPLGAEGHATPMMHLCCLLAARGLSVVYAAMDFSLPLIQSKGTWPPHGSDMQVEPLNLPPGTATEGLASVGEYFAVMRTYRASLEEVIRKFISSRSIACVITDFNLDWAVETAHQYGLATAVLFPGNIARTWTELKLGEFVSKGLIPLPEDESSEEWVICADPLLHLRDIPEHHKRPDKLFLQQAVNRCETMWKKVGWVLADAFSENQERWAAKVKHELGEAAEYLTVGPLSLLNSVNAVNQEWSSAAGLRKGDESCIAWLDTQQPDSVLYISFGSNAAPCKEDYERIAAGVEATGKSFLWVIRAEVSTEGWEFFPGFVERTKGRGVIVPWCPQRQVLAHPSVAAFLSHCGWNSVNDAMSFAQPLLCCPRDFDQLHNARLVVEEWKVGVRVPSKPVSAEEVERLVNAVMPGGEQREAMKRNALVVSQKMRKGAEVGGSSLTNLNRFVEAIACFPHKKST